MGHEGFTEITSSAERWQAKFLAALESIEAAERGFQIDEAERTQYWEELIRTEGVSRKLLVATKGGKHIGFVAVRNVEAQHDVQLVVHPDLSAEAREAVRLLLTEAAGIELDLPIEQSVIPEIVPA